MVKLLINSQIGNQNPSKFILNYLTVKYIFHSTLTKDLHNATKRISIDKSSIFKQNQSTHRINRGGRPTLLVGGGGSSGQIKNCMDIEGAITGNKEQLL